MTTNLTITMIRILAITLIGLTAAGNPSHALAQFSALRQSANTKQNDAKPTPNEPGQPQISHQMGVLAECLLYTEDNGWRGAAMPNAYLLQSKTDVDEIKYFYVNTKPEADGKRKVSVEFMVQGQGSAGLLYGLQADRQRYFLILVDEQSNLKILKRSPDGFSEMLSTSIQGEGPYELILEEDGETVSITLNGNELISFSNSHTGKGGVGIGMTGSGNYAFRSFNLEVK